MSEYIIELSKINKQYPGVKALDNVDFNLKASEVMALLGENGAGKSTLMKVLSGIVERDSGEMKIFGETVGTLSPKKAQELGIAIIHQELNLCPHLTVTENIFLGRETTKSGILSESQMRQKTLEALQRLNLTDIHPDMVLGNLPVSKQQLIEIAKAISTDAKVIIMDEPTSALTSKEIEELFKIIKKLRSEGRGIVYISHRLEELAHITDRVTIMRDGKHITTMNFKDTTLHDIITFMVGREITEKFPKVKCERGRKILEVKNLNAGRQVRDINFDIYAGEIVGFAGLMGAGRTEMTRALFGADKKDSGQIILEGKEIFIKKPMDAISHGVVLAPEDRKKDGLCTKLSIKDNIALPNLDIICDKFGVISSKVEDEMIDKAIANLQIKMQDPDANAGSLSGGNQQKVVVGKWLARDSKVVMFDEPTRGIDVAAKVEIYHLMNELKQKGIGVFFVSSEMPEVMGISDRILVMCDGRITGEFMATEATQESILESATKFEKKLDQSNVTGVN